MKKLLATVLAVGSLTVGATGAFANDEEIQPAPPKPTVVAYDYDISWSASNDQPVVKPLNDAEIQD